MRIDDLDHWTLDEICDDCRMKNKFFVTVDDAKRVEDALTDRIIEIEEALGITEASKNVTGESALDAIADLKKQVNHG